MRGKEGKDATSIASACASSMAFSCSSALLPWIFFTVPSGALTTMPAACIIIGSAVKAGQGGSRMLWRFGESSPDSLGRQESDVCCGMHASDFVFDVDD